MTRTRVVTKILILSGCLLLCLAAASLFQACPAHSPSVTHPVDAVMKQIPPSQYPDFTDDMAYDGLAHAIDASLSYLHRLPAERAFTFGRDQYSARHLVASLNHFRDFIQKKPGRAEVQPYIATHYRVYKSVGNGAERRVLFTGYYEPHMRGSLNKTDRYSHPVYAKPTDLVTIDLSMFAANTANQTLVGRVTGDRFVPYFDRDEIDTGSLAGKAAPIAWVADPVDLFFLHIQGSGKIYLDSGRVLNVHYHISNGKPYRSIGKLLIDQGKIPRAEMSMQAIRAYLRLHPEERANVFSYNPSYVFFKTESDGPLGCLAVKLTPGRSLAVDRRIFPMTALSFIQTQKPLLDGNGAITEWTDCSRFVLNQDTGGAIRGPGRGDLFWGNGPYAEMAAGHMQHPGQLYFLILKPEVS